MKLAPVKNKWNIIMKNLQQMKNSAQKGFTLIELMIVVAIIGILAAVALPAYQDYIAKSSFAETPVAATGIKRAIEVCAQINGALSGCDTDKTVAKLLTGADNGDLVASVTMTSVGVITATAISGKKGLGGETYILTPTLTNGAVTWELSGTCEAKGWCKKLDG